MNMAAQRQIRRLSGALRSRSIAQMSIQYHPEILRGQVGVQLGHSKRWRSISPFLRGADAAVEKDVHDKLFKQMSEEMEDKWYKFNGKVHYVTNLDEEEHAFRHLNSELRNPNITPLAETKDGKNLLAIGFDTETAPSNNHFHPPAVVQISTLKTCIVYHLTHRNFIYGCTFPPLLKEVLADESILKVGVGSADDAQQLSYAYGISVSNVLELTHLENVMARTKRKNRRTNQKNQLGLKKLCELVLEKKMYKFKDITCSNWGREELTDLQKLYAAHDATVAIEILNAINVSAESKLILDENILSDFLFHPENFAKGHPGKIPTVYQRSSVRTKSWKKIFVEPVKGKAGSVVSSEKSVNSLRKSDYIRSRPSNKPISDAFVRLYISYLHKAVLDGKESGRSNLDNKPLMLLPMYFPGLLRKIFHGIAESNGLYTVSHGQKKGFSGRMLSIWPSRSAYNKARDKHGEP